MEEKLSILFKTFLSKHAGCHAERQSTSRSVEDIIWCDPLPMWRSHENKGQTKWHSWAYQVPLPEALGSVQGGTEQPAVEPKAPAFGLCLERNNHSTRPVPDSARATSPRVLQPSHSGLCNMGRENSYFSLLHPSSASRYMKHGHPWMLLPPIPAPGAAEQAAIVLHAYVPCLLACVAHHMS